MQAEHISHSWRRYLRFSVRGLTVLVLVIGVWLAWLVRSAHIHARCCGGDHARRRQSLL